ncbi:MAG: RNA-binding protein [Rhizobiales bacterium]|nr:RNA-binding protein [Hyphomicrobiales bacterium]
MAKKLKRPRDPVQLAKLIGDIATGQVADAKPDDGKNPAAVALGQKGGASRAAKLSRETRQAIAKKAAAKRWAR